MCRNLILKHQVLKMIAGKRHNFLSLKQRMMKELRMKKVN